MAEADPAAGTSVPQSTINNCSSILKKISGLYCDRLLSDVTLRVGPREYPAHRLILCASSDVFQVMLLKPEWSESFESVVVLHEAEECLAQFGAFLQYLYTGTVTLTHASVLPILALADKYNVEDLRVVCGVYMKQHVVSAAEHNQLLSWLQYCMASQHTAVATACLNHFKWNFEQVARTSDFLNCDGGLLTSVLAQHDLVVHDEKTLYTYVVSWLKHQEGRLQSTTTTKTTSADQQQQRDNTRRRQQQQQQKQQQISLRHCQPKLEFPAARGDESPISVSDPSPAAAAVKSLCPMEFSSSSSSNSVKETLKSTNAGFHDECNCKRSNYPNINLRSSNSNKAHCCVRPPEEAMDTESHKSAQQKVFYKSSLSSCPITHYMNKTQPHSSNTSHQSKFHNQKTSSIHNNPHHSSCVSHHQYHQHNYQQQHHQHSREQHLYDDSNSLSASTPPPTPHCQSSFHCHCCPRFNSACCSTVSSGRSNSCSNLSAAATTCSDVRHNQSVTASPTCNCSSGPQSSTPWGPTPRPSTRPPPPPPPPPSPPPLKLGTGKLYLRSSGLPSDACGGSDVPNQMECLTYEVMAFVRFPMMTPRQLADLLLVPLTIQYKEFFVTRMAIGMAFHSGQWGRVREVVESGDDASSLLFTPRLYTTELWSAGLSVDNLPALPPFHTRTLVFSTPASASELESEAQLEWIVELYPKGVWFRKYMLIVWQGTVEVPEVVLPTVRLSVTYNSTNSNSCDKNCTATATTANPRVRLAVLVYASRDGVEFVSDVVTRRHIFTPDDCLLNMDGILPFISLNDPQESEQYLLQPCSSLKIHVVISPLSAPAFCPPGAP